MKYEKLIGNSQHQFTKGKSCLTNITVLPDEMTGCKAKERAATVVYLDFSKDFDIVLLRAN